MAIGRVKWYDKSKGYGFIESPEGDVFFHFSDIEMKGFKALAEDQRVSYKLLRSEQGLKAREIRPLDSRASVRHAARYRNLLLMTVRAGREADFDAHMSHVPAWLDALEQDVGIRSIGTWRSGRCAVHLAESDRPYEQTIEVAKQASHWPEYEKWRAALRELIEADLEVMTPLSVDGNSEDSDNPENNPD
jgi:CspA family cold shock protein